jgi:hypothetical protein
MALVVVCAPNNMAFDLHGHWHLSDPIPDLLPAVHASPGPWWPCRPRTDSPAFGLTREFDTFLQQT